MSGGAINFDSELLRHTDFFGRRDVLAKIESLVEGPQALPRGWVLLLGGPGVGKSAILAQVVEKGGRLVPHHFIRRGIEGWDRPEIIVQSLRAQIEERFPRLRAVETNPRDGLYGLLRRVSDQELFRDRRLIDRLLLVIDGLDEAADDGSGTSPLPRFLPSHLPPGVVILCGSRPTHLQPNWLDQRDGVYSINLDGTVWSSSNHDAVRALFEYHASRVSPPLGRAVVEDAVKHASGNLLYAVRLIELLAQQPPDQRTAHAIPQGLSGLFEKTLSDIHQLDQARYKLMMRGLSILCTAREALPMYLFGEILDEWTTIESEAFLRIMRPILFREPSQPAYRLYHEYFREAISEKLSPTELRAYEQLLADTIARWPTDGRDPFRRGYALRNGIMHLLRAGDIERAQRLCMDISYLDVKCREVGVSAVEQDLEATIRAGGPNAPLELVDISAAISSEASKLHKERSALPVLLYNRLLCARWSAERIERVLHFPDGPPALRVLHPVRLDTALFRTLKGHEKAVVACSLVPGGRFVLSASSDRTLRLWRLGSGECSGTLRGHTDEITSCTAMADGRRAVSTSLDGTVKIWDLEELREVCTWSNEGRWTTSCTVTPDDRYVVVGYDDGVLRVFDLETRDCIHHLPGHTAYITACVVTSDSRCISASRDGSIGLWDLAIGKHLRRLSLPASGEKSSSDEMGDSRWITALVLLDENRVVVAYGDGSVIVWDLSSSLPTRSRIGGQGRVDAFAVTSDGRSLLCGLADGSIALWDLASERRIDYVTAHASSVSACAIIPGSRRAVSASHDGTLKLIEFATSETVGPREPHTEAVAACAIARSGATLISASEDRTAKVWDSRSGDQRTLTKHEHRLTACAISADESRVLLGLQNGGLLLLGMADGKPIDDFQGHTDSLTGCAFVLIDRILSTSQDGTLRLWGRAARDHAILEHRNEGLLGCATTSDGTIALVISRSGSVTLWDFSSGASMRASFKVRAGLRIGTLSPDSRLGAFGFENGVIEICDIPSGTTHRVIPAHKEEIFGCAFSHDGTRVISASKDRTLKIHCTKTGNLQAVLPGAAWFRCVAISEERIYGGDQVGNVWIVAASSAVRGTVSQKGKALSRQSSPSAASEAVPDANGKTSEPRSRKSAAGRAVASTSTAAPRFSKNPPLLTPPGRGRPPTRVLQSSTYKADLTALRDVLADLYPTNSEARMIASDIRLDVKRCNLSGSAQLLWHAIVEEVQRQSCLDKLIQRVRKEYPRHALLELAVQDLGFG